MNTLKISTLMAATLMLLTTSLGAIPTASALGPLTNSATTGAAMDPLIPNGSLVLQRIQNNIRDDALGRGDCIGAVQSASYALGGGLWLYAYELECHCGPNWDVGYAAVGGGLKVALNGNVPLFFVANNDANPNDDSFHTTNVPSFTNDFANFNANNLFSPSAGDFTIAAIENPTNVEFLNANGIFLSGDVAGFVTGSPPTILRGAHLGGSNTVFELVVPTQVERLDKFLSDDNTGPDIIQTGLPATTEYRYTIEYENADPTTPQSRLVDTVAAEFDVVDASTDVGVIDVFQTSKGKKINSSTKITVDLPAGAVDVTINVIVTTRENPGGGHKDADGNKVDFFKPTSCEVVFINSGPIFVYEVDPNTGAIVLDQDLNKVVILGPSDVLSIIALSDLNNDDIDYDGIPNLVEIANGTDPCDPDTDHDGLGDNEENGPFNNVDPTLAIQNLPQFDPNNPHFLCLFQGTSPILADTDGDGLTDGREVHVTGTDPGRPDTDFDFLLDGAEIALGTDPFNDDTDGDGALDGQDADPLNPEVQ